jgi:uncharacterized protein (DUF934 family)
MWLLKKDGSWLPIDSSELITANRVTPESFDGDLEHIAQTGQSVIISFSGPHDGRGFSFAKRLKQFAPELKLIASGGLTPDHARLCFQTGFDEILLSEELVVRQSASAWQTAVEMSVDKTYVEGKVHSNIPSIWQERALAQSIATNE